MREIKGAVKRPKERQEGKTESVSAIHQTFIVCFKEME